MAMMKDNFSTASGLYARYRPSYPPELYNFLLGLIPHKRYAWDCGTGNGQVACELSKYFQQVFATDISKAQLEHAPVIPNVKYSVQQAEHSDFKNDQFDLITVAQAIHGFDLEKFYKEVRRNLRPGGIICVMGYGRIQISDGIDEIITRFYEDILGSYWDPERKYIDQEYSTLPFPFKEIHTPKFECAFHWDLNHLIGYLNTWSAVKHFIARNHNNPVKEIEEKINHQWGDQNKRPVYFPIISRTGKL